MPFAATDRFGYCQLSFQHSWRGRRVRHRKYATDRVNSDKKDELER